MSYISPTMVVSPKASVADLRVIYDGGEGSWSAAIMTWDGDAGALGIRWNGEDGSVGNPQSRGIPTWFIVPDELTEVILAKVRTLSAV